MAKIAKITINNDGMNHETAEKVWSDIAGFAAYSFNKSHSCAYSLIGWQAMWMKVKHPIEFYAAAMSIADDKKLPVLVADATANGLTILPPDVNISTNVYVIANDTTIYAPLNATKGVSDRTAKAIIEARDLQPGGRVPFKDMADFVSRISGRLCNTAQRGNLDLVGAFARIEAGQKQAIDQDRLKDQMNLIPGVMTGFVRADRRVPTDKYTLAYLRKIITDMEAVNLEADGTPKPQRQQTIHVRPTMGDRAKYMVVTDAPFRSEEMAQKFAEGEQFGITAAALTTTDQSRRDAYWTALLKKRKSAKIITAQEIRDHSPFLDREVELLKPPLIVTLGSNAARYFIPDLKGPIDEYVGRTFWDSKRDATILIGFNPMIVTMDPDRFDELAEVFELARMIVSQS